MNEKWNNRPSYGKPAFGGKKNFRGSPSQSSHTSPQRELHDAECSNCHQRCQVPFRPNGKKPVFCTNCFSQNDQGPSSRPPQREYSSPARHQTGPSAPVPDRQIQDLKRQIEVMNGTLEKLVSEVSSLNRGRELAKVVKKHVSADKPAPAPAKKTAAKKVSTVAKSPAKKSSKK